jgi:predicted alpha/beta hydrolase
MVLVPRSIPTPPPTVRDLTVITSDRERLAATLFEPATARATVLIHGATATRRRYYQPFAHYLAEAGYRVVTYDYRGIGGSRPASLRGFRATMTDWARRDAKAVIERVRFSYPGPLLSIGHSFGGQLLGLVDEAHAVDAAIMVGAQLGYYGHWDRGRAGLAAFWWLAVPALTAVYGYLPGRFGLGGVDLPAGVAREWGRWCRSPGYLSDHHEGGDARFARFAAPTRFYSFTDDAIAPPRAVDAILDRLTGASIDHQRLSPAELGVDRIGHFGFFRSTVRDSLWRDARRFFDDTLAGRAEAAPATAARQPEPSSDQLWTVSVSELMRDLEFGRGPLP